MTAARTPLVTGNWKLHKTLRESAELASRVASSVKDVEERIEVGVAPVFTALETVGRALAGTRLRLTAQDLFHEPQGAFTGEVSAPLLKDVGCHDVIIGHSERRQLFGETDDGVAKKLRAALDHGLRPIVCIGETLEDRDRGRTLEVVLGQVERGLVAVTALELAGLVLAYEPVWAIGTGRNASPGDAQAVHAAIRGWLTERFGAAAASATRLLYGGSVKADNAASLLGEPDIDGALVGGASLTAETFATIVHAALGR